MTDHVFPIEDAADFRAWKRRYPNAEALLFRIIYRWRYATARHRKIPGRCVANPIDYWAEDAKLSRDQTKRALTILERDKLIIRERGRYEGPKVWPHIQPTPLALKHMGKPNDMDRLEQSVAASKKAKAAPYVAPTPAPIDAPTPAPIDAPNDYTSPSIPSKPSNPTNAHAYTGGKGSAGEGGKKKLVLKKKKVEPEILIAPPSDDDDVDAMIAAAKAKKLAKLDKQFPKIEGDHGLKHPSELYPEQWAGFSPEAKANLYAKYKSYVANAQKKAAKGKASKDSAGFYTGKKPGGLFGLLKKT